MYGYGPRRGFGLLGFLFGLILLGIVAVVAYNVGLSASGNAAAAPAVAPFFWFGGFHILGFLLFFLFFVFILAAIFRPRGWGHYGWYGAYGPGPWGYRGQDMRDVPPPFEGMLENWHKRAHGDTTPTPGSGSATDPTGQPKG